MRRSSATAPHILITTPESLYILLTSAARKTLAGVRTLILDEIHAVAGTKRGVHLFLSLERLEALRRTDVPLQRIGLSATQRPLDLMARALGGLREKGVPRPVEIIEAKSRRTLDLRIEMPADPPAVAASRPRRPRRKTRHAKATRRAPGLRSMRASSSSFESTARR